MPPQNIVRHQDNQSVYKETWDPQEIAALKMIRSAGLHKHPGFIAIDWAYGLRKKGPRIAYRMESLLPVSSFPEQIDKVHSLLRYVASAPNTFVSILKSCVLSEKLGDFLGQCYAHGFFLGDIHLNNLGYRTHEPNSLVMFDPQLITF